MKKGALFRWISIPAILFISNTSFAGLLMPIGVNDLYVYDVHQGTDSWTSYIQGLEVVNIGGIDYTKIAEWEEHISGVKEDYEEELFRCTETVIYFENGEIGLQTAPIGTNWSYPSFKQGLGSGVIVNEIVSIETVTVLYGTFSNAYVQQAYFDPDNPLLDNTPFWYEYIVPDVGWVKQVDYWSSPTEILELRDITTVPIPAAMWMFISGIISLATFAQSRRHDVYMTHG